MDQAVIKVDSSELLWVPNPTGSHESFWMGVQRFMYLNDLSGERLFRLKYLLCDAPARPRDLMFGKVLEGLDQTINGSWPPIFLDGLDSHSLRYADRHRHVCFHKDTPVRFCPKCLAHCYHSLLFQFPAVALCPYHEVELQQSCPECGGVISRLGFIPDKHPTPFCCTTCGKSFVPEKKVAQRVLFGLPEASHLLDEAYERMHLVAQADVASFSGLRTHDDTEDQFIRFHCHALHAAATGGAPKPRWWTGLEDPVSCRPIGSSKPPLSAVSQPGDEPPLLTEHLRPMLSTLKSINRHFSRVIRRMCRHRSPRELYCDINKSSCAQHPHFLRLDQVDCPCCAVLSWWRANWGYYLALYQAAATHRYPPRLRATPFGLSIDVPESSAQLAKTAWDSLMSLPFQMLYRLTPKTERLVPVGRSLVQDSSHRGFASRRNLSVEVQRSMRHLGAAAFLDLDQPKAGDGVLVCKDAVGNPCTVSYSLRNAMRALAELHCLRQSGPLTALPQRSFQHRGGEHFDIWYRESWKRKELKRWSWDFSSTVRPFHE